MTYPLLTTSRPDYSPQAIYLYVVPLRNDIFNGSLKKPISVAAHWAVCIQGICYELRARDENKEPNEAKYLYKWTYEKEWRDTRHVKDDEGQVHLGYLTRPYEPKQVHDVACEVWDKTFKQKYKVDFKNCQVFVRLLVDLIGDSAAKEKLPQFLDKWVRNLSLARHFTVLGIVGGATLMAVGLVTVPVDMGSTAAAGFALAGGTVCSSTIGLVNARAGKEKHIKKSQDEIRKRLQLGE